MPNFTDIFKLSNLCVIFLLCVIDMIFFPCTLQLLEEIYYMHCYNFCTTCQWFYCLHLQECWYFKIFQFFLYFANYKITNCSHSLKSLALFQKCYIGHSRFWGVPSIITQCLLRWGPSRPLLMFCCPSKENMGLFPGWSL